MQDIYVNVAGNSWGYAGKLAGTSSLDRTHTREPLHGGNNIPVAPHHYVHDKAIKPMDPGHTYFADFTHVPQCHRNNRSESTSQYHWRLLAWNLNLVILETLKLWSCDHTNIQQSLKNPGLHTIIMQFQSSGLKHPAAMNLTIDRRCDRCGARPKNSTRTAGERPGHRFKTSEGVSSSNPAHDCLWQCRYW